MTLVCSNSAVIVEEVIHLYGMEIEEGIVNTMFSEQDQERKSASTLG